jgi:glycosyltransferase involved in cell wall biosynthesis
MLAGSTRLIAVSPFVRDHALARQKERVEVIPPGVDSATHAPPEPDRRDPARPGILFVGPLDRSYRWKGVDVLWEAFRIVRRRMPQATLTLVGAGDRYMEFAQRTERDPSLRVKRRLSEPELVQEYQKASVLVLPSLTDAESFGMVLAEANACATPVVGSRVGGIPDFVRHGENGLLARPGQVHDLADQVQRLLADPDHARQMGQRGRIRVARDHDWGDLGRRTERVLEEAVAAR